jgi:uncharacterized protein (DUF849 family)
MELTSEQLSAMCQMSKKTKTQHTWQATQAGKSMMAIAKTYS